MDKDQLILQLQENRRVSHDEEIQLFLQALDGLAEMQDYRLVPELLTGFDDEAAETELMFSLIHVVEKTIARDGTEIYLKMLFETLVTVIPFGKEWMKTLLRRVLNSLMCLEMATYIVKILVEEHRICLTELLLEIRTEDPALFEESATQLLEALEEVHDFFDLEDE